MEIRRHVAWISGAKLGCQGLALCFDLLNCTALSWPYRRSVGVQADTSRLQQPRRHADQDRPAHCFSRVQQGGDSERYVPDSRHDNLQIRKGPSAAPKRRRPPMLYGLGEAW